MDEEVCLNVSTSGDIAQSRGSITIELEYRDLSISVSEVYTEEVILIFTLHQNERMNTISSSSAKAIINFLRLTTRPHSVCAL